MPLMQVFAGDNVLTATQRRIGFLFDHYENIQVSVSGGKDSQVLAHLLLVEAQRRNRKLGLFFFDEEVMYQSTIDMITYMMEDWFPDHVIPLWLQIEFNLTNATSYTDSHLVAWEAGKGKIWMRPKKSYAIKMPPWDVEKQIILDRRIGLDFYAVIENFENCYTNTAFCAGLRGVESPNRWRTMVKNPVAVGEQPIYWATKKQNNNVAFYPLYDWTFSDIWRYIHDNKLRYSKIYDYYFRKGTPINEIRVSSLIHERSFKSIVDLPEFEPDTYNKLLKRIKGIAFAQETARQARMFRAQKLPQNFKTWRSYRDFLLETYPRDDKRDIFRERFARHLENEWVARQQCRQLILGDFENNVPVTNRPDPREQLISYYREVL